MKCSGQLALMEKLHLRVVEADVGPVIEGGKHGGPGNNLRV